MSKRYSQQFKEDVLAFYANNPNTTVRQLCKDFGITTTTFYSWRGDDGQEKNRPDKNSNSVTPEEMRTLQKRNHELEQENLILKRAAAYFAKDALPKGNTLSS